MSCNEAASNANAGCDAASNNETTKTSPFRRANFELLCGRKRCIVAFQRDRLDRHDSSVFQASLLTRGSSRDVARTPDDYGSCDAIGGITNVLAIHHGVGLFGACDYKTRSNRAVADTNKNFI